MEHLAESLSPLYQNYIKNFQSHTREQFKSDRNKDYDVCKDQLLQKDLEAMHRITRILLFLASFIHSLIHSPRYVFSDSIGQLPLTGLLGK